jgi:hypothetical protein
MNDLLATTIAVAAVIIGLVCNRTTTSSRDNAVQEKDAGPTSDVPDDACLDDGAVCTSGTDSCCSGLCENGVCAVREAAPIEPSPPFPIH